MYRKVAVSKSEYLLCMTTQVPGSHAHVYPGPRSHAHVHAYPSFGSHAHVCSDLESHAHVYLSPENHAQCTCTVQLSHLIFFQHSIYARALKSNATTEYNR